MAEQDCEVVIVSDHEGEDTAVIYWADTPSLRVVIGFAVADGKEGWIAMLRGHPEPLYCPADGDLCRLVRETIRPQSMMVTHTARKTEQLAETMQGITGLLARLQAEVGTLRRLLERES